MIEIRHYEIRHYFYVLEDTIPITAFIAIVTARADTILPDSGKAVANGVQTCIRPCVLVAGVIKRLPSSSHSWMSY